jgi:protein-S-isoprenylcysteine O-methyltransferase Ste14
MALAARVLTLELTVAAFLFTSAGRLDLPWFWAVLGLHTLMMFTALVILDPGLMKERMNPGPGGRDRRLRAWLCLCFMIQFIVAGLDVGRYGWSGPISPLVQCAAFLVYACGMILCLWAMAVNRFFSPVVRLQEERGHRLVTDGPYRHIRHPGYAGILLSACVGIALGSWWSLLPLVVAVGLILRRTALEDRFLRTSLEGYASYAEHVRYRLIPGIW